MKKLLFTIFVSLYSFVAYTAQPATLAAKAPATSSVTGKIPITAFKPVIPDVYIHNVGNQVFTLNSISFLFSINGQTKEQPVQYKIKISPNKIKKITGTKIVFNLPETTELSNSGISEININNNQNIKISNLTDSNIISNGTSIHIYLTNAQGAWKETAQPKVLTPAAKIAPAAKNIIPSAKTSTLKSAATVVKAKANTIIPKSNTAKAVQSTLIPTQPENVTINPQIK